MKTEELGTESISKLIVKQAIPAAIGFLVMSIYMVVDTIFVGHWVGSLAIGAITVVMPITFLISSIGMSIGVGGASMISRFLGKDDLLSANQTFGNQISLNLGLASIFVILGILYQEQILSLFGAKGDILPYAKEYFHVILYGIPFLAWAMMSNNVMRAEGKATMAMLVMLVPAVLNTILDPIFIYYFDMGLYGAGLATTISYISSALFSLGYFIFGKGELKIIPAFFKLRLQIIKEIGAIGSITLARQGTISLLAIVLNNSLFSYGGEFAISVYGIVSRMMMFSLFPVMGLTQGFLPIAGYNYGAENFERVKETVKKSILYGTVIASVTYLFIFLFADQISKAFTTDPHLLENTPYAMVVIFMATPLICMQLIGTAYYQALGKAIPALLLTLTKQGFFLIPLVLILPIFWSINGIWYAFPISDILSSTVTYLFLRKALNKLN